MNKKHNKNSALDLGDRALRNSSVSEESAYIDTLPGGWVRKGIKGTLCGSHALSSVPRPRIQSAYRVGDGSFFGLR